MSFRIGYIWAWTQVDENDEEGILGFYSEGTWMPLIASDRVRLDEVRAIAGAIVTATGRPAVLRKFQTSIEVDRIDP